MKNTKPILLVEDDSVDAMTIKRAFAELKITNKIVHVTDSEAALDYLRNIHNKKPGVVLLDLNMPKMDGIEFLKVIKSDQDLKQIPVVILTVSAQEQDIVESFSLGVAGYITKPNTYEGYIDKLKTVEIYWSFSELPNLK